MAAISSFNIQGKKNVFGQDPMCQTFFITGQPTILAGVDLYFFSKDSVIPFNMEIRNVVKQVPSQTVVPFSRVYVSPSNIQTSDDASIATYIRFDSLVYLEPGEYALVLNSNSSRYRVWVSQLGEKDTTTNIPISKQPYVGLLYKSQNASTWIPSPEQDLKFTMYRAKFDNTKTGYLDMFVKPDAYEKSWLDYKPLQAYPNSKTLKVFHPNHGLTTGSDTKLAGFNSIIFNSGGFGNIFGVNVATIENVEFPVSNIKQNSYTITLPATSNVTAITREGESSLYAYKDLRFDAVYPHIVSVEMGGTSVELEGQFTTLGYSIDSIVKLNKDRVTEFNTAKVLPSNVNIINNMSGLNPFLIRLIMSSENDFVSPLLDLSLQSVVLTHNQVNQPTYASENLNDDIVTVAVGDNIYFTNTESNVGLISLTTTTHQANAALITKGTYITVTGAYTNNGTFRVLDVIDDGANIKVFGNIASNVAATGTTITNGRGFIAEEAARGGSALSKYITRQIDFANPSTAFNLRLDISRPDNADVKIYYKVKEVNQTSPFIQEEFIELPNLDIPTSQGGEFYEIEKQVEDLQPFNAMMFKIVLLSSDSADIPKCKNFRVIGLA